MTASDRIVSHFSAILPVEYDPTEGKLLVHLVIYRNDHLEFRIAGGTDEEEEDLLETAARELEQELNMRLNDSPEDALFPVHEETKPDQENPRMDHKKQVFLCCNTFEEIPGEEGRYREPDIEGSKAVPASVLVRYLSGEAVELEHDIVIPFHKKGLEQALCALGEQLPAQSSFVKLLKNKGWIQ